MEECIYIGKTAVYKGPFKSVVDDDGHVFARGEEVEIRADTALKLSRPPYAGMFIINEPTSKLEKCCEGKC